MALQDGALLNSHATRPCSSPGIRDAYPALNYGYDCSLALGFVLSILGSILLFIGQLGSFASAYISNSQPTS